MTVIGDLEAKIAKCREQEEIINRRIDAVPDNLPDATFNRRLNQLEAWGIEVAEEREGYEQQLATIQQAVREETAAVY